MLTPKRAKIIILVTRLEYDGTNQEEREQRKDDDRRQPGWAGCRDDALGGRGGAATASSRPTRPSGDLAGRFVSIRRPSFR